MKFIGLFGAVSLLFGLVLGFQNCGSSELSSFTRASQEVVGIDSVQGSEELVTALKATHDDVQSEELLNAKEDPVKTKEIASCAFKRKSCADRSDDDKMSCIVENIKSFYDSLSCYGYEVENSDNCFIAAKARKKYPHAALYYSCLNTGFANKKNFQLDVGRCYEGKNGSPYIVDGSWINLPQKFYSFGKAVVEYDTPGEKNLVLFDSNSEENEKFVDSCGVSRELHNEGLAVSFDIEIEESSGSRASGTDNYLEALRTVMKDMEPQRSSILDAYNKLRALASKNFKTDKAQEGAIYSSVNKLESYRSELKDGLINERFLITDSAAKNLIALFERDYLHAKKLIEAYGAHINAQHVCPVVKIECGEDELAEDLFNPATGCQTSTCVRIDSSTLSALGYAESTLFKANYQFKDYKNKYPKQVPGRPELEARIESAINFLDRLNNDLIYQVKVNRKTRNHADVQLILLNIDTQKSNIVRYFRDYLELIK